MIEHMSLHVKNYEKAKAFYTAALAPLDYKVNMEFDGATGFMEDGHTSFWVVEKKPGEATHLAFRAKSREAVQAFYDAALEAGAKDNGKPGLRKDYSPDYYAAFVLDPEGNNIEAVTYEE